MLPRTTLFVPPEDVTDVNPAPATAPVVRLTPCPVVLIATLLTVSVPKEVPDTPAPEQVPTLNPFSVLFPVVPSSVIPLPLEFVIVGAVPAACNVTVPDGVPDAKVTC